MFRRVPLFSAPKLRGGLLTWEPQWARRGTGRWSAAVPTNVGQGSVRNRGAKGIPFGKESGQTVPPVDWLICPLRTKKKVRTLHAHTLQRARSHVQHSARTHCTAQYGDVVRASVRCGTWCHVSESIISTVCLWCVYSRVVACRLACVSRVTLLCRFGCHLSASWYDEQVPAQRET